MSSRKRKHPNRNQYRNDSSSSYNRSNEEQVPFTPDPVLFIQAHEAEIIRGPRGRVAAESLEVKKVPKENQDGYEWVIGGGLIRWGGDAVVHRPFPGDDDDVGPSTGTSEGLWVDRYDVRLLLDTLPTSQSHQKVDPRPNSPSGWSDLPSDSEDTFFLSPEEIDDYHREKRRKLMEKSREERLKARMAEDGEDAEREETWGGSDEEPDEPQKELMRRTAKHIMSSPNPAQLEMRILANHGGDKRFAFLRGRWKRSWEVVKGLARIEIKKEQSEKEEAKQSSGLGLADYGDSDVDDETGDEASADTTHLELKETAAESEQSTALVATPDDDAVIQARRARAKEWMEKRRALTNTG